MKLLPNKEVFESIKRVKNDLITQTLLIKNDSFLKENETSDTPEHFNCDTILTVSKDSNKKNDEELQWKYKIINLALDEVNKLNNINLIPNNRQNSPNTTEFDTWWLFENYYWTFFIFYIYLIYHKIISPAVLISYTLGIASYLLIWLQSIRTYKLLLIFIHLSIGILSLIELIVVIINENAYSLVSFDEILIPIYITIQFLTMFLLITCLPKSIIRFKRSWLVFPIFSLYTFLLFNYFTAKYIFVLVLGLAIVNCYTFETDLVGNKYSRDLVSKLSMILVTVGSLLFSIAQSVFLLIASNRRQLSV